MKNKLTYVAAIVLAVSSVNSKANYAITESDGSVPVTAAPGQGGKTTFTLTFANDAGNVTSTWNDLVVSGGNYYTLVDNSGGAFSSLSLENSTLYLGPGKTFNNKDATHTGVYNFVVDWTLAGSATIGDTENFTFTIKGGFPAYNGQLAGTKLSGNQIGIDVAAVPEPGQALAGAVLLGCGALVFTGRRWIKAQAAK